MPKSIKQFFFVIQQYACNQACSLKIEVSELWVSYLLAKLSLVLPPLLFQAVKRGGVLQHSKSAHGKHLRPIGFQGEIRLGEDL